MILNNLNNACCLTLIIAVKKQPLTEINSQSYKSNSIMIVNRLLDFDVKNQGINRIFT